MQNIIDICNVKGDSKSIRRCPMKNLKMKFARMEKDMSQIELAKRIGVTRQTIGMIEAGDYNPSLKLCLSICWALGLTLNDLFWEDEPNEKIND